MHKPNAFYRFETSWNAGFYPDNQIVSNILNDVYTGLITYLPTVAIVGVTNLENLRITLKAFVETYNAKPYFGEVVFQINYLTTTDWVVIIYNESLLATDNTQAVIINGTNDTGGIIDSSPVLAPFAVGSYSGSFDAAPIPTEAEVANAMLIATQYGTAMFPLTYKYNGTTNIATSGLARGKNWTINSNGEPTRLPVNSQPMQNARRFRLPTLTSDEKFIITFLEKVIQSSLDNISNVSIENDFDSYTMPAGWTKDFTYDSATYDRIQINAINSTNNNVFTIIGRLDGAWLWQRFVKVGGSVGSFDFLGYYSDTTPLPYDSSSADSSLYFNEYYEFDFCDFVDSCYVSPEFYPMPAIQGDSLQFNIPIESGNLIGLSAVKVGLFETDGTFIQQIGTATKESLCFSQMYASVTIPAVESACYRLGVYDQPTSSCELAFTYLYDDTDYLEIINAYGVKYLTIGIYNETESTWLAVEHIQIPELGGFTELDVLNFANSINGMTCTWAEIAGYFTFDWVIDTDCDATYSMQSYIGNDDFSLVEPIWTSLSQTCTCQTQFYLYSLSNLIQIDAADCFSTILEFWSGNDSIAQGFEYTNNWKQRIRLGINGGGAKPIIEESVYRQSNGVHKRPQNKQDLSLDLHTDFLDEETQLALVDATRHPYLVWNQKPIFVNGEIEVATVQDFSSQSSFETLAQVKFSALVQGFQPKNSTCLNC